MLFPLLGCFSCKKAISVQKIKLLITGGWRTSNKPYLQSSVSFDAQCLQFLNFAVYHQRTSCAAMLCTAFGIFPWLEFAMQQLVTVLSFPFVVFSVISVTSL